MVDSEHWLWRLSAGEWLEAAAHELELARERVSSRRTAITHARRAAGMALNGVLVAQASRGWSRDDCEQVWGRSYVEHLRVLAQSGPERRGPIDAKAAEGCGSLLAIPVMPSTGLVHLAPRKDAAAVEAIELASVITRTCAAVIGS